MLPKPLTYGILILITAVWAANFGATLFIPSYESDAYIHVIFMGTVGLLLGLGQRPSNGDPDAPRLVLPRLPWGRH